MITIDERLKVIRWNNENEYGEPTLDPNRPFPPRDPAFEQRIERALNMARVSSDTSPPDMRKFIAELDTILFRLRYRDFFTAVSLLFHRIERVAEGVKTWAHRKAEKYLVRR